MAKKPTTYKRRAPDETSYGNVYFGNSSEKHSTKTFENQLKIHVRTWFPQYRIFDAEPLGPDYLHPVVRIGGGVAKMVATHPRSRGILIGEREESPYLAMTATLSHFPLVIGMEPCDNQQAHLYGAQGVNIISVPASLKLNHAEDVVKSWLEGLPTEERETQILHDIRRYLHLQRSI